MEREIGELKAKLHLSDAFCEKLLKIEELTMFAKKEGELQIQGKLGKHEHLSPDDLPGSMSDTAFRLRAMLVSLTKEEMEILKNYLKDDFWFPSEWSAGSY